MKTLIISTAAGFQLQDDAEHQGFTREQLKAIAKATKVFYELSEDANIISALLRVYLHELLNIDTMEDGLDNWVGAYVDICNTMEDHTMSYFYNNALILETELQNNDNE
jgi:hypothetical protein